MSGSLSGFREVVEVNLDASSVLAITAPILAGILALIAVRRRPEWKRPLALMGAGVVVFLSLRWIFEGILQVMGL